VHTVRITLSGDYDGETAQRLGEAFDGFSLSASAQRTGRHDSDPWILAWQFEDRPDPADLAARLELHMAVHNIPGLPFEGGRFSIEKTPDINWLEKVYQDFPAFTVGPFFIHGSHHKEEIPEGLTGLLVDAATAFGSGEHETTRTCLEALIDLKESGLCPWNILDMGTGSGILAIAAWLLWKSPVLAVDNDEECVRMTKIHVQANKIPEGRTALLCAHGDGFKTPEVNQQKPYELIIANILAGPVIEMAPSLVRVLDDNGYAILSGMLREQADLVASAYEGEGMMLHHRYDLGDWTTLVMRGG
jgi:ribosomal protein L11 methyltransferase